MKREMYKEIEKYMISCMNDVAHDCQHIYRVLYFALDISTEFNVDKDVLIAASLLHDIGREAQYKDSKCDHAIIGADMAYEYLISIGWTKSKAEHVRDCISAHSFRSNNIPSSIEAKILFDADKLDATGTIGIARTIVYNGIVSEPLYSVDNDGNVLQGKEDENPSFFKEYNWKLKKVYDKFYTNRASEVARERQKASVDFYENMYNEINTTHQMGLNILKNTLDD